ncbi:MAG: hypothetical protein KF847_18365 [Pirellulales bacterium]|nr:hypothetical protein [Pirellulales bacterium]
MAKYRKSPLVPSASASARGETERMLVNKLSVDDARRMLRNEGGEMSPFDLVVQGLTIVGIAGLTAWAIRAGEATAWHLFLPMLAQYVALLVALPGIYLVLRHPDLKRDTRLAVVWVGAGLLAWGIAAAVRGANSGLPATAVLAQDAQAAYRSVVDTHMQWPMLAAVASCLSGLPRRVRNLYEHGPPFVAAGMGCAARVVVPLLGCFLLPAIAAHPEHMAWYVWAMIVGGECIALWMTWDVQTRLRKYDAAQGAARR